MTFFRRAQVYGIVVALVLIGYFIVPFAVELAGTSCSLWSFGPNGCEVGVRGILRGAVLYCMLAGYLISRLLDREPLVSRQLEVIVAALAVILFGLPLWLVLHAAFW